MYGPSTASDDLSTDQVVYPRSGFLFGAFVEPPTTGVATLTIYDSSNSTTAGKKVLLKLQQFAGNSTTPALLPVPVIANQGIFCQFTGTGATYQIHYAG